MQPIENGTNPSPPESEGSVDLAGALRPFITAIDAEALTWLAMGIWQRSGGALPELAAAFGAAMAILAREAAGRFGESRATAERASEAVSAHARLLEIQRLTKQVEQLSADVLLEVEGLDPDGETIRFSTHVPAGLREELVFTLVAGFIAQSDTVPSDCTYRVTLDGQALNDVPPLEQLRVELGFALPDGAAS